MSEELKCEINQNGACFTFESGPIMSIFIFANGNVAVCDRNGQQIPEMQGRIDEVISQDALRAELEKVKASKLCLACGEISHGPIDGCYDEMQKELEKENTELKAQIAGKTFYCAGCAGEVEKLKAERDRMRKATEYARSVLWQLRTKSTEAKGGYTTLMQIIRGEK